MSFLDQEAGVMCHHLRLSLHPGAFIQIAKSVELLCLFLYAFRNNYGWIEQQTTGSEGGVLHSSTNAYKTSITGYSLALLGCLTLNTPSRVVLIIFIDFSIIVVFSLLRWIKVH